MLLGLSRDGPHHRPGVHEIGSEATTSTSSMSTDISTSASTSTSTSASEAAACQTRKEKGRARCPCRKSVRHEACLMRWFRADPFTRFPYSGVPCPFVRLPQFLAHPAPTPPQALLTLGPQQLPRAESLWCGLRQVLGLPKNSQRT